MYCNTEDYIMTEQNFSLPIQIVVTEWHQPTVNAVIDLIGFDNGEQIKTLPLQEQLKAIIPFVYINPCGYVYFFSAFGVRYQICHSEIKLDNSGDIKIR